MQKFVFSFFLFINFCRLSAQQPNAFSLDQAIQYAKQHVTSINNAKLDVKIAEQRVKELKSIGLPQANASYGFNAFAQLPIQYVPNFSKESVDAQNQLNAVINANSTANNLPFVLPTNLSAPDYLGLQFAQRYTSQLQANVSQLIFDGTYLMGLKAAGEFIKLQNFTISKNEKDVEDAVTKAYNLALITKENMNLIDINISFLKKITNDTRVVYQNGFAEKLDLDRLTLRLSNLETQKNNLQQTYVLVLNALKMQMNMPMADSLTLTDTLSDMDVKTEQLVNEKIEVNAQNRVEYKTLEQAIRMQDLDMKRHRFGRYPTVVGFFNYNLQSQRNRFNFYDFSNLPKNEKYVGSALFGIQAKITLFDGFRNKAQMAQIKFEKEKLENTKATFENAVQLESIAAKTKIMNARNQLIEQKKNVALAEEIFKKSTIKFKEGVGSTIEITQADTELKTAQINYLNALYDLVIAKFELKKTSGN